MNVSGKYINGNIKENIRTECKFIFLSKTIKIMTSSMLKIVLIYYRYYDKNGISFSLDMSAIHLAT